jgi:hypothetical protein
LYHDLFSGLILQEATHYTIQINSIDPTPFEVLDGDNVHIKDREDKASSHELSNFMPYQHFSWDEGNDVVDVYQTMSSSISSSILINRGSSSSSIPLVEIVDVSDFHHCLKDMPYTMVGDSSCISFHPTNLSHVYGCLKYKPREAC